MYGPTTAGHAAHAARPSNRSYAYTVIAQVAAQAKCAQFNGNSSCTEVSVEVFLKHEMFSGGSVPKFEQSKGKKHLDKHATNDGHVREAVYASAAFTADQPVRAKRAK